MIGCVQQRSGSFQQHYPRVGTSELISPELRGLNRKFSRFQPWRCCTAVGIDSHTIVKVTVKSVAIRSIFQLFLILNNLVPLHYLKIPSYSYMISINAYQPTFIVQIFGETTTRIQLVQPAIKCGIIFLTHATVHYDLASVHVDWAYTNHIYRQGYFSQIHI